MKGRGVGECIYFLLCVQMREGSEKKKKKKKIEECVLILFCIRGTEKKAYPYMVIWPSCP